MTRTNTPTTSIGELLARTRSNAMVKAAAGDVNPSTTHPTAGKADDVVEVTTGEQDAAWEKKRKELEGPAPSESTVTPSTAGELEATTNPQPVGEDPKVERDISDGMKDPGTSHPANANERPKYSEWAKGVEAFTKTAEALLTALNTESDGSGQTGKNPGVNYAGATKQAESQGNPAEMSDDELWNKTAAEVIGDVQRQAIVNADRWVDWVAKCAEEDEAAESEEPKEKPSEGGSSSGESEGSAGAAAESGAAGGDSGAAMEGGDSAGGDSAGGDSGDLQQLMALLQAGGAPGGAPGGDALGGQMDAGQAIPPEELAMLAQQQGIPLEALMALMSGGGAPGGDMGGGAPGGMPGGAPGGMPMGEPKLGEVKISEATMQKYRARVRAVIVEQQQRSNRKS